MTVVAPRFIAKLLCEIGRYDGAIADVSSGIIGYNDKRDLFWEQ
jgi:hypothetical protein